MKKLAGNPAAKTLAAILFVIVSGLALLATLSYVYRLTGSGGWPYVFDGSLSLLKLFASILHNALVPVMIILWLLALPLFVFLLYAAGRHNGEPAIRLNWMDRIPLDLYLLIMALLFSLVMAWMDSVIYYGYSSLAVAAALIPLSILAILLLLGITMSLAARFKCSRWWQNSITYRLLVWLWKLLRKLAAFIRKVADNLPILWKLILGFCLYVLFSALFLAGGWDSDFWLLMFLALNLGVLLLLCSAALQMKKLQQGGERLAHGDLSYHLETEKMSPDFRRHGEHLNSISNGMAAAVEERLKSERFKTELITNVSHDLKTPLTSIINYVDLLQKEQIDNAQAKGYIDVLSRQSARLRKLTEDLIEVSKASTGNVAVTAEPTNVTELINQCLGEYSERFQAAQLTPVVIAPESDPYIMADGRLLWRVFDNLLNNICKYSQPGTRVYCDIAQTPQQVRLSLKNVSRDSLNISAGELQERFVRGDSSRGSEGSGLGLAIASSLTELQGGSFSLHVDGDLFKSILIFNRMQEPEK